MSQSHRREKPKANGAGEPPFRATCIGFLPAFSGGSDEEKDPVCIDDNCVGRRV